MSDTNEKKNPVPEGVVPRSPEEFQEALQGKGQEKVKEKLNQVEENNKLIGQAQAVSEMLNSEGWAIFWNDVDKYLEDFASTATIAELQGDLFQKAQAVERIQGKLELMDLVNQQIEFWLKKAKEKAVDVEEIRKKHNLDKQ